jgi:hypothetical protein
MPSLPNVSAELLTFLKTVFPDQCPDIRMSDREVWMAAGAAKVVRKLALMHEEQCNARNIIEGG